MNPILRFIIGADTSRLKRDLTAGERAIAKLKGAMLKMGGVLAGVFALGKIKDFAIGLLDLGMKVQGVKMAFDKLNNPNLLNQLRTATNNTVADFELMKAAVNANNFKIPVELLGKYLQFASIRAKETGESVDFLVESIVKGVARKSLPILDNLGLNVALVSEEFKKTGNMATAVGNIIDREMGGMIDPTNLAGTSVEQLKVKWANAKSEIATSLMPTLSKLTTWLSDNIPTAIKNAILYFKYFRLGIAKISESLRIASANFSFFTKWISNPFAGAGRKAQWAADFAKDVASAQKTYEDFAQDIFGTKPKYMHLGRGTAPENYFGAKPITPKATAPELTKEEKEAAQKKRDAARKKYIEDQLDSASERREAAKKQMAAYGASLTKDKPMLGGIGTEGGIEAITKTGEALDELNKRILENGSAWEVAHEAMIKDIDDMKKLELVTAALGGVTQMFNEISNIASMDEEDRAEAYKRAAHGIISAMIAEGITSVVKATLLKSAALGPFAIPIAAAAGAGAAMLFNIAIPKFAKGGIVPSGFSGDSYPAMLSSGETVLPKPKSLGTGGGSMNVHGVIFGDDLLLVNQRASRRYNSIRGYANGG